MNSHYFVLYMPSCRCDPIGAKEYDEQCKEAYNLEKNKIKVERHKYADGINEYLSYWILVYVKDKEEALDKALVIMEESEIPNDVYKMMKTDVENYKKGVISHCGICKDKIKE